MSTDLDAVASRYSFDHYTIRRKVFKLFGGAFHILGPDDQLVLYSSQKAFKLKEDFRIFTDESMENQVLSIQARKVLDFSSAYDVIDTVENQKIGALRRKGMKSMLRDEWLILDCEDREIGLLREDSTGLAILRRFVDFMSLLLPQKFHANVNGQRVLEFKQNINPFVQKVMMDFSMDQNDLLDRRMGLATGILICAIEGRQS